VLARTSDPGRSEQVTLRVRQFVTFPIVCPRPEAKFVRKSPVSRSMRWCQKHRILCLWRHSVSESTNWTLSMSKSLNAEEADDGLENCLLPSFGAPGRSRRVQSNEDTCLISASEMSVAYFPNRCIDENTEIVRKQHVGSRNSDAGKQETCLSLRHENRSGMLLSLDMRTFARCVPISTRLWPNLVEAIEWILHRHTLRLTEARLCAQCSYF